MAREKESILVVPTEHVYDSIGYVHGFRPVKTEDEGKYLLRKLLTPHRTIFLDRDSVEHDLNFKQIIPYCLVKYHNTFLWYQRGKGVGESRLMGNVSLGIGGHIKYDKNTDCGYSDSLLRELDEEVQMIGALHSPSVLDHMSMIKPIVGFINDNTNMVGTVHLGIVHMITVHGHVEMKESELKVCGMHTWEYLKRTQINGAAYENWTDILLKDYTPS
jgi:predicted NUDIX family phosphoesterase